MGGLMGLARSIDNTGIAIVQSQEAPLPAAE